MDKSTAILALAAIFTGLLGFVALLFVHKFPPQHPLVTYALITSLSALVFVAVIALIDVALPNQSPSGTSPSTSNSHLTSATSTSSGHTGSTSTTANHSTGTDHPAQTAITGQPTSTEPSVAATLPAAPTVGSAQPTMIQHGPFDLNLGCQEQRHDPDAFAKQLKAGDPYSWRCVSHGQDYSIDLNAIAVAEYGPKYCAFLGDDRLWYAAPCKSG